MQMTWSNGGAKDKDSNGKHVQDMHARTQILSIRTIDMDKKTLLVW
jgi:hypothetical protein